LGKTSLALGLTVILGTVLLILLVQASRSQVGSATLGQYGSSVGQYADTAREGFENSRGGEPSAAAAEGSDRSGSSESAATSATPSGFSSDAEGGIDEASEDELAVAEMPEEPSESKPARLPETGGPGATALLWVGMSLLALGPGARVVRGAER
jgi:hypothetical protein